METIDNLDYPYMFTLLKNSKWDYEYCHDRIDENTMDEYIFNIQKGIDNTQYLNFLDMLGDIVTTEDLDYVLAEYDSNTDETKESILLFFIGDRIARQYIDCIYSSVTFICII